MSLCLTTYLKDHHAGSAAGTDLFERVAENHSDPEVRTRVARIAGEIAEDQAALQRILDNFDSEPSGLKDLPAKIGEKIARLKPNKEFTERSPLSDVLEMEMLVIAVHGKSLGWAMLAQLDDPRIDQAEINRLYDRARAQLDELEALRLSQATKLLQEA
ncbi:MAG: DUF892 family protein [Propionibacterium sp.]|nr:DUF892 family protein [Propionibacterium sp.]